MFSFALACSSLKIFFFVLYSREGDITKLKADVIVNTTNEALNDKNPMSERIYKVAGYLLRDECRSQLISK